MACAVWSPVGKGSTTFGPQSASKRALPRALRQYESNCTEGDATTGFGVSFYEVWIQEWTRTERYTESNYYSVIIARAGFPFRCLRWTDDANMYSGNASRWVRGIETNQEFGAWSRARYIPLMPEPVGMVLNVLIVSAAIVLPRMAWRRAIVFRRRRKKLCLKCGYPIEPSVTNCPECGQGYASSVVLVSVNEPIDGSGA